MQAFIPFETKSAILYDYYQLLIRLKVCMYICTNVLDQV